MSISSKKSTKSELSSPRTQVTETDAEIGKIGSNVARIYQGFNLNQSELNLDRDTLIEKILVFLSYVIVVVTFPLSLFVIFVVVRQFERAVILRNGKLRSTIPYGPGLIQYLPCVDTVKFTDLRIICYEIPPQEALTKDALTIAADAVIYYKIYDPIWAVVNVADYKVSTQFLAATTLRNALGTRRLSDILCDRSAVSFQVFRNMKNLTMNWGVKIVGFELKDISLPLQLQRAMATEAESVRIANAKIIAAKSEIESTRNLQKATKLLMNNPYCMQTTPWCWAVNTLSTESIQLSDLAARVMASIRELSLEPPHKTETLRFYKLPRRREPSSSSVTFGDAQVQLRYLQALQMIAGDKTHTIVLPFSAESLKKVIE